MGWGKERGREGESANREIECACVCKFILPRYNLTALFLSWNLRESGAPIRWTEVRVRVRVMVRVRERDMQIDRVIEREREIEKGK